MTRVLGFVVTMIFLMGPLSAYAQEGFEIEADLSFADSEAALVEAEEAEQRRNQERRMQQQAEAEAKHQMEEARRVEADAKKRIAQMEREEARAKAAREKAEAETAKALERQEVAKKEVAAAELKLQEAESQRDEALASKEREIETHRLLVQQKKDIEEQTKNRKAEHIALLRDVERAKQQIRTLELQTQKALTANESDRRGLQNQLAKQRQEMFRLAERVGQMENSISQGGVTPAAQSAAGARSQQGTLKAKRNCNVRARPSTAANILRQVSAGTSLQARRVDARWVQLLGGGQEYMAVSCFQ